MNVLHVIPSISLKHGGPSHAVRLLTQAARQVKIDVAVVTTNDDGDEARLNVPLGKPVERNGVVHFFFRRNLLPYKVSVGMVRWLEQNIEKFDLVHIHALFSFSSTAAALIARHKKIPYVVRPLGVLNRWGMENRHPAAKRLSLKLIELPILRHAAAIHFTSNQERKEAAGSGIDPANIRSFVVPIPVLFNGSTGSDEKFRSRYPTTAGRKLILFVSRIDKKKGLEMLFEAFAMVKPNQPESMLVISGDGEPQYINNLRTEANRLNISRDILWTGFLDQELKADAYAAASAFVLPSHSENFGIAAAEALAAGVACVLTHSVALTDYLQDKDSALIVRCDARDIADALCRVLTDAQTRERLATRGRQVARQCFSVESVGQALAEEYRRLLSAQGGSQNTQAKLIHAE